MQKYFPAFILLLTLSVLFFPVRSAAQNASAESTAAVPPVTTSVATAGATAAPSAESVPGKTAEVVSASPSAETAAAKTGEVTVTTTATATLTAISTATATALASTETRPATPEIVIVAPPVEGASYKGVPWGADFSAFKAIKGYAGNLGPQSAVMIGSSDDNDIALLLGVPVSGKDANGGQRVMFEYMPQKFAAAYFEPDDTYYIFYNGKFAMTFAYINSVNFDLYRDTFYKKYEKIGDLSKKYELGAKRVYQLQAGIFAKGITEAFLIKSQLTNKKTVSTTAKLVFAYNNLFDVIRKEITDKMAADKLSGSEKSKQQLLKDLNKIE